MFRPLGRLPQPIVRRPAPILINRPHPWETARQYIFRVAEDDEERRWALNDLERHPDRRETEPIMHPLTFRMRGSLAFNEFMFARRNPTMTHHSIYNIGQRTTVNTKRFFLARHIYEKTVRYSHMPFDPRTQEANLVVRQLCAMYWRNGSIDCPWPRPIDWPRVYRISEIIATGTVAKAKRFVQAWLDGRFEISGRKLNWEYHGAGVPHGRVELYRFFIFAV